MAGGAARARRQSSGDFSPSVIKGGRDKYRSSMHRRAALQGGDRSASAAIGIEIDVEKLKALQRAIAQAGGGLRAQDKILYTALNEGMDRFYTRTKQNLQRQTSIRQVTRVEKDLHKRPASSGRWEAKVIIKGRPTRITKKNYGARWKKTMPGVSFLAWGRQQMVAGSFMTPSMKPAFIRVGRSRLPIHVVPGPHFVKEVVDRKEYYTALAKQSAEIIIPRAYSKIKVIMEQVKAAHGL